MDDDWRTVCGGRGGRMILTGDWLKDVTVRLQLMTG